MKFKKYSAQLFDLQWNFVDYISSWEILNSISFTKQINGGQGQLNLRLNWTKFENIDKQLVIKLFEEQDWVQEWNQIYLGRIINTKQIYSTWIYTELEILWVASLLTQAYFNTWLTDSVTTRYTFTLTSWNDYFWITYDGYVDKAIDILISCFEEQFWTWLIQKWTVITWLSWFIWDFEFDQTTLFDFLTNIVERTWTYWYLNNLWFLDVTTKPTSPTFIFTYWKDINSVTIENNLKKQKNRIILSNWTDTVESWINTTEYWNKTLFKEDTNIPTLGSWWLTETMINLNNKYSYKKWSCKLEINNDFEVIDSVTTWSQMTNTWNTYTQTFWDLWGIPQTWNIIQPWMTCRIVNLSDNVEDNLQIVKVTYTNSKITIQLESYNSYLKDATDWLFSY